MTPPKHWDPSEVVGSKQVWAKRSGRPNLDDAWELWLHDKEMLRIFRQEGESWYLVQNRQGEVGYAHKTWLSTERPVGGAHQSILL